MLLVPRSTSTSSATSVTASTAGYGGWAGGDHTMGGGGAWQHGTREHIYIYIYRFPPVFFGGFVVMHIYFFFTSRNFIRP